MRLKPAAPLSPVKHSTTEPLRSLINQCKLRSNLYTDKFFHLVSYTELIHCTYQEVTDKNFQIKIISILELLLANSADPDEKPHFVAFHLSLHCLPKYLFTGSQCTRGLKVCSFYDFDILPVN